MKGRFGRLLAASALSLSLGAAGFTAYLTVAPHVVLANAATVYTSAAAVTPSDVTVLPPTTALWVGGAGTVAVQMADGTAVTFSGVTAGYLLPVSVTKVKSTGTSGTLILALN